MKSPPQELTRARELVRLIEQESIRLQTSSPTRDPAVPSLVTYVDELRLIIDGMSQASNAEVSQELKREMRYLSRRAVVEAAWWLVKKAITGSSDD